MILRAEYACYFNSRSKIIYLSICYMSIVAFKKKSVIKHGSKRSGRAPGGEFVTQGPFGLKNGNMLENAASNVAFGPEGFSLAGTRRNVGRVGQSMAMSKSGTPFRGLYPVGNGGCCNQYATPLPTMNSLQAETKGNEYLYVKPSVLSQRGMLRKKFKYLYNGQYPNYIVKEVFTGDQVDNASQGVYLSKFLRPMQFIKILTKPQSLKVSRSYVVLQIVKHLQLISVMILWLLTLLIPKPLRTRLTQVLIPYM